MPIPAEIPEAGPRRQPGESPTPDLPREPFARGFAIALPLALLLWGLLALIAFGLYVAV
jgi:hypothetical protein